MVNPLHDLKTLKKLLFAASLLDVQHKRGPWVGS